MSLPSPELPADSGPEPTYSVQAVAAALDRDEDYVRTLIHAGDLVGNRVGRLIRVRRSSYLAYLDATEITPERVPVPS